MLRLAFFGSPAFALPVLQALHQQHQLVLVVSQPDKPAGRGYRLQRPAVAQWAHEAGVPLAQPATLRKNKDFAAQLEGLELDVAITAAYGKILPTQLLTIPTHGFLNVHGSLLPKYRGAAPIQQALIAGEQETGITIMQTDVGMDTGAIRLQCRTAITAEDDAHTLFTRLAELGATTLLEALAQLETGSLPSTPQDETAASHAAMLSKDDGRIRWHETATQIDQRHRGVAMWPKSFSYFRGKRLGVKALHPYIHSYDSSAPQASPQAQPGEITAITEVGVIVQTGSGSICLTTVQPAGKQAMAASDWARGYQVKPGNVLGQQ